MAGPVVPGPLCGTMSPNSDAGTSALMRSPRPGTTCVFHGTATRRVARVLHKSAHTLSIEKARGEAIAMLTVRLNDLDAWNEATQKLFEGWFGTTDARARAEIRQRIVKAIHKLTLLHDSDFISDPTDSDFAYVYPDESERGRYERTVHLGKAFWAEKDDKTRAGTLIHEVSHFLTVGHTDDVGSRRRDRAAVDFPGKSTSKYGGSYAAYGGAGAARLAISHPALALKNADSFEFFIEGRKASVILDEKGNLDTEGFGDFPTFGPGRS